MVTRDLTKRALRHSYAQAVLPAVTEKYLQKDFAEPVKMIARTAWDIANELAGLEIKHRIKEREEDASKD